MEYTFREIEKKWRDYWKENKTYKVKTDSSKPKCYVLDMFPYPSGAGLHVGHPLGYIATDIYSRFKRLKGFNVLHPMGYDAYGLPAEQYAIQTGQHPAKTTDENIKRYREQLDNIGFSFDWSREVRTCDPSYYKWTQWIFIQLFHSWYNNKTKKAEYIETLISELAKNGNQNIEAATELEDIIDANTWNAWNEKEQQSFLLNYRLAYLSETTVNWCPELGTVLANEEVKDGLSERGGHPVEKKLMKQWSLRISAYADRLLQDLDTIDWTDALKESQKNWIGKSVGASLVFDINQHDENIEVFTTRPDTIFGVTFMVLAPEHELVAKITTTEQKQKVESYIEKTKHRSERERMADAKTVSGAFTGAYVMHPFTNEQVPVWIADYVLAGYGTGAVMAVPGGDQRDWAFAKHFDLPIVATVEGGDMNEAANDDKEAVVINSDFLNGMKAKDAIKAAINKLEEKNIGKGAVNFRLRDAIFSRQRYWGEPFPIYYKDDIPYTLNESELPLELPEVDKYLPTETGDAPLARAKNWKTKEGYLLETDTMPGWAGSSWYYLRYMDPNNETAMVSEESVNYWKQVDLYLGGSEHATGHLLYVRFWTKFLYDIGKLPFNEPAKKLVNQGMIQGVSSLVYRINNTNKFVSNGLIDQHETTVLHIDVSMVSNDELDLDAFKNWRPEFKDAEFVLEDGKYICGSEVEKMSKRWHNVVNPDDVVDRYGADTLRMYEMFLGPIELSKPWSTNGIDGVYKFLKKYWRLFIVNEKFSVSDKEPNGKELKSLHKTIKKIEEDIERLSFNTCISAFMICVNELSELKCNKRAILEPLTIVLASFAPHITEEVWQHLGHQTSVTQASYPKFDESKLVEDNFSYPVSVNGKTRFKIELPLNLDKNQVEKEVLDSEQIQKWLEGNNPKKVIVVPGRIVNVVV